MGTCDGCVAVDVVLLPAGKARIVAAVIVLPCDGIRLSAPCDGLLKAVSGTDDEVATWPCASSVPETSVSAEGGTVAALPCQTGDAAGIPVRAWLDSGRDVGFVAMVDETSAIDSDILMSEVDVSLRKYRWGLNKVIQARETRRWQTKWPHCSNGTSSSQTDQLAPAMGSSSSSSSSSSSNSSNAMTVDPPDK